jgi:hypothetical protein
MGSFFLLSKRNKKHRLKIFAFEASAWAWAVEPEKFVRPISVERGYGAMA